MGAAEGRAGDPKTNHLAVHTEDHPLDYASFAGEIPQGEYGGGQVTIWDRGTTRPRSGPTARSRSSCTVRGSPGRYVLFPTNGKNWIIHRMDPPVAPDAEPMPERVRPVRPEKRKRLPTRAGDFAYEFAWGGRRLVAFSDYGSVRAHDARCHDAKPPRGIGEAVGHHRVVLDGEVIDAGGGETYMVFDLLYLDGRSLLDEPYRTRRDLLGELDPSGPNLRTAPAFDDGDAVREAAREQGLDAILAKPLDGTYHQEKAGWRLIPV